MSKANPKTELQTIDPAALAQVSGGAKTSEGSDNTAVMTALSGILDSLSSLSSSRQNSGMSTQDVMLFMMMMQQRNAGHVVAAAPQPTNWTWDATGGYWIVR